MSKIEGKVVDEYGNPIDGSKITTVAKPATTSGYTIHHIQDGGRFHMSSEEYKALVKLMDRMFTSSLLGGVPEEIEVTKPKEVSNHQFDESEEDKLARLIAERMQ